MLQRITLPGIELPRLYMAENKNDAEIAREKGIPYIVWRQGKDSLLKTLLLPTLKKMFPHIKWNNMIGIPKTRSVIVNVKGNTISPIDEDIIPDDVEDWHASGDIDSTYNEDDIVDKTVDIAENKREIYSDGRSNDPVEELDVYAYLGDLSSQVNLEVLQELKLMPSFIGDIMDCIKKNVIAGTLWSDGYNKKKGACVGNYDRAGQLKNLIIVDISHSIPIGIAATMLCLIDTLRTQVCADLIITGGKSRFYPYGSDLPTAQGIRNTIPRSQECVEFYAILKKHIRGNHYGHVISFGDDDCPARIARWKFTTEEADNFLKDNEFLEGTVVEEVHNYHTFKRGRTGYVEWCFHLAKTPKESFDNTWCHFISKE